MRFKDTTLPFIALLGLLYTLPVESQQPQRSPWSFTVDGGGAHQSEVDLKNGTGGFSVDRWFMGAGLSYSWGARASLGAAIGGGRSIYDFNELAGFGAGEPWGTIEDSRLSVSTRFGVGEKGMALVIPTVRLNGEKGTSNADRRTYGLFGAIFWRINEDLSIGPGADIWRYLRISILNHAQPGCVITRALNISTPIKKPPIMRPAVRKVSTNWQ